MWKILTEICGSQRKQNITDFWAKTGTQNNFLRLDINIIKLKKNMNVCPIKNKKKNGKQFNWLELHTRVTNILKLKRNVNVCTIRKKGNGKGQSICVGKKDVQGLEEYKLLQDGQIEIDFILNMTIKQTHKSSSF